MFSIVTLIIFPVTWRESVFILSSLTFLFAIEMHLIVGTFRRFIVDISEALFISSNTEFDVEIRIRRPNDRSLPPSNHDTDLAISFVDWAPRPPDRFVCYLALHTVNAYSTTVASIMSLVYLWLHVCMCMIYRYEPSLSTTSYSIYLFVSCLSSSCFCRHQFLSPIFLKASI